MKKKITLLVLLAALASALIYEVELLAMMACFPQMSMTAEDVYGADQENLKDFVLDENKVLTSTSDDPWIVFELPDTATVHNISVYLSEVQSGGAIAQCFLMPGFNSDTQNLQSGKLTFRFAKDGDRDQIESLRLDLTSCADDSMKLERVVINSRSDLALELLAMYPCVLILTALFVIEIWLWREKIRQQREQTENGKLQLWPLCGAIVQGAVKLVAIGALMPDLLLFDLGSHEVVLGWMMLYSLELTILTALVVQRYHWNTRIWGQLSVLPFCAIAMFSASELLNVVNFSFTSFGYLLLNLLLYGLPALVLGLLIRRVAISVPVTAVVFMVWSLANHFFGSYRGNPLEYSDMLQAGTAANVMKNYSLTLDAICVAAIAMAAALSIGLISVFGLSSWKWNKKVVAVSAGTGLSAILLACVFIPNYGLQQSWDISGFTSQHGYMTSFLAYTEASLRKEKPDGYSATQVDQLLGELVAETLAAGDKQEQLPNVIVIMDETFADLPSIYQFETDTELLPFISQLTENTIKGDLLVSIFGGGTANTEYEFLTGNSLYALPAGCSPYVQYMLKQQQSIAWDLKSMGYQTLAYHPFYGNGYRRATNYPLLGFDSFYDISADLPNQGYIRSYISDSSDFSNLIYLYEQRDTSEPVFYFNVTMQNHGGYSSEESAVPVTVEPLDEELQLPQVEEYLSLVHETDQAFSELVEYFSNVEENTIILLFGDHQPSLGGEANDLLVGSGEGSYGENSYLISSFVMWANFDIDEADGILTSPNYLRALLVDQAGIETNAYERFLLGLYEEYPAINANGYYDSSLNWFATDENEPEQLHNYRYLVYNNVFDKKHLVSDYYEHS